MIDLKKGGHISAVKLNHGDIRHGIDGSHEKAHNSEDESQHPQDGTRRDRRQGQAKHRSRHQQYWMTANSAFIIIQRLLFNFNVYETKLFY